jgi:DNA replication licensing factor MCM2
MPITHKVSIQLVKYDCVVCGHGIGPIVANWTSENSPRSCPNCQSKGPFALNSENTIYRNFQRITIQESPGSVPAGRLPRQKEVVLLADLIDSCKVCIFE